MIFPFVWRVLPGPVVLKVLELLVLLAAVVWVLFTFVFPWIAADILPPPDGTVDVSPTP
ncbi:MULTISPECIES: hypothetical protein [unclassified Curtobacterium]|uniref:hypothetical protein n=1 Tax=unclassified Curtobacterium TaxID=257496 RepID=UPI000AF61C9A|nr:MULTISPECIES: hypothetical protein [unclassified Curtobacterium]WIA98565.1 hypothetical protein QOL16_03505 [Curtobacterium sp. MCBA15_004]WIB01806.1 hypothetical protein QOL15_03615 [Curtobacterium sp. MCBA15_012]